MATVTPSDSGPAHLGDFPEEGTVKASPVPDDCFYEVVDGQIVELPPMGAYECDVASFLAFMLGQVVHAQQLGKVVVETLFWLDRAGKILGPAGEPGLCVNVALSPDGRRAALARPGPQGTNIWLLDFANKSLASFTFGKNGSEYPVWSTDGRQIFFCSLRDGNYNLYRKPANGEKDEELLLRSHEDKTPTSCSGDGRYLLYTARDQKTKNDLWVLPLEGDLKPIPFLRTEFDEWDGHFSPDTRWIAYVSNESASNEVYVRAFAPGSTAAFSESGAKWMVSMGGGTAPRWRADGKELFYLGPDGRVMSVDVTVDTTFHGGTSKPLLQPPMRGFSGAWNVAADGKRFLFMAPKELGTPTPFTVVLNWQVGLRK